MKTLLFVNGLFFTLFLISEGVLANESGRVMDLVSVPYKPMLSLE